MASGEGQGMRRLARGEPDQRISKPASRSAPAGIGRPEGFAGKAESKPRTPAAIAHPEAAKTIGHLSTSYPLGCSTRNVRLYSEWAARLGGWVGRAAVTCVGCPRAAGV